MFGLVWAPGSWLHLRRHFVQITFEIFYLKPYGEKSIKLYKNRDHIRINDQHNSQTGQKLLTFSQSGHFSPGGRRNSVNRF